MVDEEVKMEEEEGATYWSFETMGRSGSSDNQVRLDYICTSPPCSVFCCCCSLILFNHAAERAGTKLSNCRFFVQALFRRHQTKWLVAG